MRPEVGITVTLISSIIIASLVVAMTRDDYKDDVLGDLNEIKRIPDNCKTNIDEYLKDDRFTWAEEIKLSKEIRKCISHNVWSNQANAIKSLKNQRAASTANP